MNDLNFLKRFDFKSLVIDEGHRLKNFKCKLLRCLREVKAESKVLLTGDPCCFSHEPGKKVPSTVGTPLQNSLSELWSILNFILPEIFTRLETFEKWFDFSAVDQVEGKEVRSEGVRQQSSHIVVVHSRQLLLQSSVIESCRSSIVS